MKKLLERVLRTSSAQAAPIVIPPDDSCGGCYYLPYSEGCYKEICQRYDCTTTTHIVCW